MEGAEGKTECAQKDGNYIKKKTVENKIPV